MSKRGLNDAVDRVRKAIEDGATPGAVVLVARRGEIVVEEALGALSYDKDAERVGRDTMYDLASLTKVIVTTTLSMILFEREQLDLESPVTAYIPEFSGGEKDTVLVKDLLAHSGGLLWWSELYKKFEGRTPEESRAGYIETICAMPLDYPPRSKTSYSDLGVLLLGEILERITGKPLDVLAKEELFEPLGMDETLFQPPTSLVSRIAPTERDEWRGRVVHGRSARRERVRSRRSRAARRAFFHSTTPRSIRTDDSQRRGLQRETDRQRRHDRSLHHPRRARPRQ